MEPSGRPDSPAVSTRVTGAILIVLCLGLAWMVHSWVTREITGRSWDQDPAGPVYLSPDGRTLLAVGSPMDRGQALGGCGSNITVDLEAQQTAHTVALHYHLRQVGDPHPVMGSCAQSPGYFLTLGHPLSARTVTDRQGHTLAIVDGRLAPQLRDPQLLEPTGPVPCPTPRTGPYCPHGWLMSTHTYAGRGATWTFTQIMGGGPPGPTGGEPSTRVGGAPAVCNLAARTEPTLSWSHGDFQLILSRRSLDPPASDQAVCTVLVQEAGFVR
ncbi:hypothetical protein [Streptacidiphilus jiangxiensis]|uniref:Uncharacterized protein n=1 Tax=Streptacidiphilus jiangxiensis TaxID=235985 RepID=A0A1H7TMP9_STRJI|nr:hypothetical protein [Streptacidiphilus jiangxiensis]SEL85845.1 hypothetical protein SAMN05414137_11477 [Streptacidiphilus jiangxiensis]